MVTTLGLLGLMNEPLKNLIRELLRVTPYLTPFLRGLVKPLLKKGMKLSTVVCVLKKKIELCVVHKLVDH
jgi:hypothetical protein